MRSPSILDEIGVRRGTDKSSLGHDYLRFYESFFAPIRDSPLTILEIGVLNGASMKVWEEYFPAAKIVGFDTVRSCKQFERDRVIIEIGDQSRVEDLERVAYAHGPFDIVIEDGSHRWNHQILSIKTLFPAIKPAGVYVVEDLQTNFGPLQEKYRHEATMSCVDFLKQWLDLRVGDDMAAPETHPDPFLRQYSAFAEHLTFYRRACLIKKATASA